MKSILFVINNLNYGGAERILVDTVNELSKDNSLKITVLLLINQGVYISKLEKKIKVKYIFNDHFSNKHLKKIYWSLILRIFKILPSKIQHTIFINEKYDIESAFLEGAPTKLISGAKKNIKKFAWIQIDPIEFPKSTKAYLSLYHEKKAYSKLNRVFCVSTNVLESYEKKYKHKNGYVLHNLFDDNKVKLLSEEKVNKIPMPTNILKLINVGRLMPQKAQDRLIRIHKKLLEKGIFNYLYIIGDGYEKDRLKKLIEELDVSSSCFLLGYSSNPYKYIKKADLYICSSIAEGYSTIITETIIIGTPIITTQCSGMKDILGNSEYGIIVENNEEALFEMIYHVCTNNRCHEDLLRKAEERKNFFSKEYCIGEIKNAIGI